jgi:P-type conjugative transfer protein TrbJ
MTMRKILLAAALLVAAPVHQPAQAIVCENCSSEVTALLQAAQQAKSYLVEFQQLQTSLEQYANMIRNSIAIPFQAFATVQADISRIQQLSQLSSLLTGNTGSIIGKLSSLQTFSNEVGSVGSMIGNMPQQFGMWQQTLGNSAKQFGAALGVQQTQITNNATIMQAIQAHSQSAAGQMQAIQAGNEMAAANGAVMAQMEETLIGMSQQITTTDAVAADRQSQEDAVMVHMATSTHAPLTGQQGF